MARNTTDLYEGQGQSDDVRKDEQMGARGNGKR